MFLFVLFDNLAGFTFVFRPDVVIQVVVFLAVAVNARYGGPVATPEPGTVTRLLTEEQRQGARALGLAIRLACDLSGRSPQLLVNARAGVKDGALVLTASDGYADVLLGEQTRRRGKALAEAMGLKLDIRNGG